MGIYRQPSNFVRWFIGIELIQNADSEADRARVHWVPGGLRGLFRAPSDLSWSASLPGPGSPRHFNHFVLAICSPVSGAAIALARSGIPGV